MRAFILPSLAAVLVAAGMATGDLLAQSTPREASMSTYYPRAYVNPPATTGAIYSAPMYTTYFYPSPLYTAPIFSPYYSPPHQGYDPFFRSFYFAPGPSNYFTGLNDYYASPRYWNYYYPGY